MLLSWGTSKVAALLRCAACQLARCKGWARLTAALLPLALPAPPHPLPAGDGEQAALREEVVRLLTTGSSSLPAFQGLVPVQLEPGAGKPAGGGCSHCWVLCWGLVLPSHHLGRRMCG